MSAPQLISRLFTARSAAHIAHLKTNSFAEHKALNEFYDDIVGLADSFAETYQGIFGLITEYPSVPMPTGKPVNWIKDLRDWCKKTKEASIQGQSELGNIHDEICALCASTVYKLKYLDNPALAESSVEPDSDDYMSMSSWKS